METQHAQLIQQLIHSGALKHQQIIDAFEAIDRADFVLEGTDPDDIYDDRPLPIGHGQTISQPSTVALMLELLQPQSGERILDVGSGSGWTTALLGQIVGTEGFVYGVEIVPELVAFGRGNVAKYQEQNILITQSFSGQRGDKTHAPYDRILVSAAAREIPTDLVAQLKIGGIMVAPVRNDIVVLLKKINNTYDLKRYGGFVFVPLIA